MQLPADARGVYPIAPTPFFDDGRIDHDSLDRLTDFYLQCGATGITALGQLGEAPKLEHDEGVALEPVSPSRCASSAAHRVCRSSSGSRHRDLPQCGPWHAR